MPAGPSGARRPAVRAATRLDHPNIVRIVDYDLAADRPYLLAEHCGGGALDETDLNAVPLLERLRMFLAICRAVAHAHDQGVVHRDLKPSNIFLSEDRSTPVVGDFGLCLLTDKGEGLPSSTKLSERAGTWHPSWKTGGRTTSGLGRTYTRLARCWGLLPHRPHIAMLDEAGNVREGFLEPADFEPMCAHLPSYLADVARFAYVSAWRIGAIRALEWRDVNLCDRTLQLRASSAKNKRARTLPLVGELLAIMERRAAQRDPAVPFVFTGCDGGRLGEIRKAWNRACQAAGGFGTALPRHAAQRRAQRHPRGRA